MTTTLKYIQRQCLENYAEQTVRGNADINAISFASGKKRISLVDITLESGEYIDHCWASIQKIPYGIESATKIHFTAQIDYYVKKMNNSIYQRCYGLKNIVIFYMEM